MGIIYSRIGKRPELSAGWAVGDGTVPELSVGWAVGDRANRPIRIGPVSPVPKGPPGRFSPNPTAQRKERIETP